MTQQLQSLWSKLNQDPIFLLLGQNYLRLNSGDDPFLNAIWRKFGSTETTPQSYRELFQILDGNSATSIESQLKWMQRCGEHISIPDWLQIVAQLGWNGIYTSAIDGIFTKAFETDFRSVESILEEKFNPSDPRNRLNLHCTFLFGAVNRVEETERPPFDDFAFVERENVAVALARRLPESVTPFGLLLIEGYAGNADWFSPKLLYPILNALDSEQAHLFSVTPDLEKDVYIQKLVQQHKVVLHSQGLAQCLVQGQEAGLLQLGQPTDRLQQGRRIQVEFGVLNVPQNIWNQVSKSALILEDSLLLEPKPISDESRYSSFRRFLAEVSTRASWEGYARGFAFRREFEQKLYSEVEGKLRSHELKDEPIIVHGQAGTGKSVALSSLAFQIRKEKKYPVLYIERKSQRLISSDVDAFCQWAEDAGAPKTLVVWDGMIGYEDYSTLLRDLESRGRKVVLVGSCYRLSENTSQISRRARRNFFEASSRLTIEEGSRFAEFLATFDSSLVQPVKRWIREGGDYFLVALYHQLPETRNQLRAGLADEAIFAEQEILRQQSKTPIRPKLTTLGQALLKGAEHLITDEHLFTGLEQSGTGEQKTQLQQLIGLVMVPGQFGIRVPLDLLMRALQKGSIDFVELIKRINTDLFHWSEDSIGNISVGPRHSLEAKLILQSPRYGGMNVEIELALQLLIEVQVPNGFGNDTEIQFAFELVRNFGSNGLYKNKYSEYYYALSNTLTELREKRGVQHPRLMLQEAMLLREFIRESKELQWDRIQSLHEQAKLTLETAIEQIENSETANRRQLAAVLVEFASVTGSYSYECSKAGQPIDASRSLFQDAKQSAFRAFSLNSDYYAVDVIGWVTELFLQSQRPINERAEAIADVLHAFSLAGEETLDVLQQQKFQERRQKFGQYINDRALADSAFAELAAAGSTVGYYLRAQSMLGELRNRLWSNTSEFTLDDRRTCQKVVDYLQEHDSVVGRDERCLFLLLRLWWIVKVGKPMFGGNCERQAVPFSLEDWQYCLTLIESIIGANVSTTKAEILFLRGFALFHLDQIKEAVEVFRELERQVDKIGRQRVVRSYVASEFQHEPSLSIEGIPRRFTGEVQWRKPEPSKVGSAYVKELRHSISFIPNDFRRPNIRQRESLGSFHIAFNFLGPIAEPIDKSLTAMEEKHDIS